MGFYYRTKTGIPGLFYTSSSYRRGDLFFQVLGICVTMLILFGWIFYLIIKYFLLAIKWLFNFINDNVVKKKSQ